MKLKVLLPPFAALALMASTALAQTPFVIAQRGTPIPGVGDTTQLIKYAVNDNGEWLVMVGTNNPDGNIDCVILRSGFLTLQEGTIVGNPPGASIDEFGALNIDINGNSTWDFDLVDPNTATNINEGLYLNTKLLVLNGDLLNTPGYGRTATWFRFNGAVKATNTGYVLIGSEVNDAAIAGFSDQSMILLQLDNLGNIISSIDIGHEGGNVPVLPFTIPANGLPYASKTQFDLNDSGQVLWQSRLDGTGNDAAIFLDDELLVQEGDPSPIAGQIWLSLNNVRMALNDRGDWVMLGSINGPSNRRALLTLNGDTFLRERETFPAINPLLVDNFAINVPVLVSNAGDPIYRAQWTGPNPTDTGIMMGLEIVVREGTTRLDGLLIDQFVDSEEALAISPGGRYIIFECTLEDGSQTVGMSDVGRVTPIESCVPNEATLVRQGGFAVAGKTITLAMDEGQGQGVTPFLLVSDRPIFTYPPCGIATGFGELIIDFGANGNPFLIQIGNPFLGVPVPINVAIANLAGLINAKVYAQGIFFDIGNLIPNQPQLLLTNAVEIEIGAP